MAQEVFKNPVEQADAFSKEKTVDDYTDDLFKAANVTTFNSKKFTNPNKEIVEIRRFGKDQNAIRFNETTGKVEQVWINGKRIV